MLKLLKHGRVYGPQFLGEMDLLVVGDKIGKIAPDIDPNGCLLDVEVIDCRGKTIVPGFIDQHVHMIGGGGEAGFYSRTPEIMLSGVIASGITTLVGLLGTDGTARHLEALLAKARGLETEGVTTYIYTGSFEVPPVTITGSVKADLILIDKVIGTGEIAISDHRSSEPTKQELKRVAADTRVGGMISGKPGVVHLHLGTGKDRLNMVMEIVRESEIPIRHFIPTHVNRQRHLFEHAMEFAKMGGVIDITSGVSPRVGFTEAIKPSKAVMECLANGVPLEKITMSSDGNGSMAVYNERGKVERLMVTTLDSMPIEFRDLVRDEGLPMEEALAVITANPAKALGLYPAKGSLSVGADADIVVLDENLQIDRVMAKGRTMLADGQLVVRGTFE